MDPEALYRDQYGRVRAFAWALTGNWADAEDLAQEVFLRALRAPPRSDRNLAGWLRAIALNLARDGGRRAARFRCVSWEALAGCEGDDPLGDPWRIELAAPDTPETLVVGADFCRRLLATLPPAQRRALALAVAGYGVAESAAATGRTYGGMQAMRHRARQTARAALDAGAA